MFHEGFFSWEEIPYEKKIKNLKLLCALKNLRHANYINHFTHFDMFLKQRVEVLHNDSVKDIQTNTQVVGNSTV